MIFSTFYFIYLFVSFFLVINHVVIVYNECLIISVCFVKKQYSLRQLTILYFSLFKPALS